MLLYWNVFDFEKLERNDFLLFRAFRGLHFGCGFAAQEILGAFSEIVSL
jgi:hypothetical protein